MSPDKNNQIPPEIRELISKLSPDCVDKTLFEEILTTLLLMANEHKDRGDYKLIDKTLKELRASFILFKPFRETRKVAIFGSARIKESDRNYELTKNLAKILVENNFLIISGAGGGVMQAANEGAGEGNSFGLNIKLPHEQAANPFIRDSPHLLEFKYFFTRKLVFIKESHATVLLPGGFGTLDEGFENITLFQTGKCMPRPIVLLDHEEDDFWDGWLHLLDTLLIEKGYCSNHDELLIKRARNAEEALDHVKSFYRVFHSLRYVRGKTILRLNTPLSAKFLAQLNHEFQDILIKGKIESTGPLKEELKQKEYLDLPRISLHFDKKSFGRLNLLITQINQS
ncbi:MAG: TIGR00730 family Rossman fold protein [Nitrospinae bacterium]|nr:TIGR00730 family Rossman fold protein [Nitrospinota bacterium]